MLAEFLSKNRDELVRRCRVKAADRAGPKAAPQALEHGIPMLLAQIIEVLRKERVTDAGDRNDLRALRLVTAEPLGSEVADSASAYGRELLSAGFTVSQLVHNYGDVCQAVTELATETGTPISTRNFHTFNRCLDEAIADAVTAFTKNRDPLAGERDDRNAGERLGDLAQELRDAVNTAMLSFAAIKTGRVAAGGATASVVERSLFKLREITDRALVEVRLALDLPAITTDVEAHRFIAEVEVSFGMEAHSKNIAFAVEPAAPGLLVRVDRHLLESAVSNLLQNAFEFTRPNEQVILRAYSRGDRVLIEVEDQSGSLAPGTAEAVSAPFKQQHASRSGFGLGVSIARRAVEAIGGVLDVRSLPGTGCIFTIELPRTGEEASSRANA